MNHKAIANRPAKVICLGEILFDCLADELGKSVSEVTSWTSYPGGAPANVASALTKLGTSSAFIGCVGQDDPGNAGITSRRMRISSLAGIISVIGGILMLRPARGRARPLSGREGLGPSARASSSGSRPCGPRPGRRRDRRSRAAGCSSGRASRP